MCEAKLHTTLAEGGLAKRQNWSMVEDMDQKNSNSDNERGYYERNYLYFDK